MIVARWMVRNLAGYSLALAGAFLTIPGIPGPGTPILLLGLALADWPGKRRFFRWLRNFHWFEVCDAWIYRKLGFRLPEHASAESVQSPPPVSPGQ